MARPKKLLPSGTSGNELTFSPPEDFWSKLSASYGRGLTHDDHEQLTAIIDSYFVWRQIELASAPAAGAIDRISQLKKAAAKLHKVLRSQFASDSYLSIGADLEIVSAGEDLAKSAEVVARDRLRRHWDEQVDAARYSIDHALKKDSGSTKITLERLSTEVCLLVRACQQAERDFFTTGDRDAWKELVWRLVKWAHSHDYPCSARKDTDKRAGGGSEFVRLIQSINQHFPKVLKRHDTENTIAEDVSTALAEYRKRAGAAATGIARGNKQHTGQE